MKRKGFTLIELLVVIGIIAILAAILLPVFAAARENARKVQCLSNQKQIGTGLMMYVQDYDETYPMPWFAAPAGNARNMAVNRWYVLLQPYLKSIAVYECPSLRGLTPQPYWPYPVDYSANLHILRNGGAENAASTETPLSMAEIDAPADYWVFIQATRRMNNLNWASSDLGWIVLNWVSQSSINGYAYALVKHTGGTVVTCADGHSVWCRLPELNVPANDLGQIGERKEGPPGVRGWGGTTGYKVYTRKTTLNARGF